MGYQEEIRTQRTKLQNRGKKMMMVRFNNGRRARPPSSFP
jgi:hypothetical protein